MKTLFLYIFHRPVWLVLITLTIILASISPAHLKPVSLLQMLRSTVIYNLIAIGQTVVVLSGCVDLSTGPMAVLTMLFTSQWARGVDQSLLWILPTIICIAVCVGTLNGILVSFFQVEPMIVTLVMATVLQGVYLLYTKGAPKGQIPSIIRAVATRSIEGLMPQVLLLWFVVLLLMFFISRYTILGRQIYYVGSNKNAAWLSGMRWRRTIIGVYITSALLAGLAGLILGGSVGYGTLQVDPMDYSFFPLIIVLVGGTEFVGAQGGVINTAIGSFAISILLSVVTLFRVGQWGKYIVQGLLILFALAFSKKWRR